MIDTDCPRPTEKLRKCKEGPKYLQHLHQTLQQECSVLPVRCPDGCYCVEGFARRTSINLCYDCVPESDSRK